MTSNMVVLFCKRLSENLLVKQKKENTDNNLNVNHKNNDSGLISFSLKL